MNIVSLLHPNKLLVIEPLRYANSYDFHNPHRHDYFEIILVKEGAGYQFVDFTKYGLKAGQVFTIYPGQVHLLERQSAEGLLIQFRKDIFDFIFPLKHHQLYFSNPNSNIDSAGFDNLYQLTESIFKLHQEVRLSPLSIHKTYSYLQIILISIIECGHQRFAVDEGNLLNQFLSLMEQNIKSKKKVVEYAEMLSCSTDKLNTLCRKFTGKAPLKLIHEETLLEIRRLMLLNQLSLKEISNELNFDSQANFSNFIKTAVNKTPSELHLEMSNTYNN